MLRLAAAVGERHRYRESENGCRHVGKKLSLFAKRTLLKVLAAEAEAEIVSKCACTFCATTNLDEAKMRERETVADTSALCFGDGTGTAPEDAEKKMQEVLHKAAGTQWLSPCGNGNVTVSLPRAVEAGAETGRGRKRNMNCRNCCSKEQQEKQGTTVVEHKHQRLR